MQTHVPQRPKAIWSMCCPSPDCFSQGKAENSALTEQQDRLKVRKGHEGTSPTSLWEEEM